MPEFSATSSALGYYYQIRYALFVLLKDDELNGEISLETMDDITFGIDGSPVKLIQTKHHISRTASLTDASADLWKTIRIWSSKLLDESFDPNIAQLILVTTASAPSNSVASLLGPAVGRNIQQALSILRQVAETSNNNANRSAYNVFLRLTEEQKYLLLNSVKILTSSPDIADVVPQIHRKLTFATRPEFIESVYQRLEGWWFDRAIKSMEGILSPTISFSEAIAKINDISEQFHKDNLPIDFLSCSNPSEEAFDDNQKIFIEQLRLIAVSQPRIYKAISDYYRAYQQRSKWLREDLLGVNELEDYEKRLIDEWERRFYIMRENLNENYSEEDMKHAGRDLYNHVDENANICIRPACTEPYVMRGSYHMLANKLDIGWHTQFVERLQCLLGNARDVAI